MAGVDVVVSEVVPAVLGVNVMVYGADPVGEPLTVDPTIVEPKLILVLAGQVPAVGVIVIFIGVLAAPELADRTDV